MIVISTWSLDSILKFENEKKSYLLFVAHSPTPPVQEGGDVGTKSDLRVSKD